MKQYEAKSIADVSIIMVTCKRPTLLANTLNSLQEQTVRPAEVLIIDNGSTPTHIAEIQDLISDRPHIKLFTPGLSNTSAARNFGLDHASSTYLIVLDDDDFLHCEALQTMVTKMDKEQLDICFTNYLFFHSDSINIEARSLDQSYRAQRMLIALAANIAQSLPSLRVRKNSFAFICYFSPIIHAVMLRRGCIKSIRFDTSMTFCEDLNFWHQLTISTSQIGFCNLTLSYYRRHAGNLTNEYSITDSFKFYQGILDSETLEEPIDLFFLHLKLWKYGRRLKEHQSQAILSRSHLMKSWRLWLTLPLILPSLLLLRYNRTVGK